MPEAPLIAKPEALLLSEQDLYLFNEGSNYRIHEKMGAHLFTRNGQKGAVFSVWAPNARELAVVGSFNEWDSHAHRLEPRGSSGIWEGFVPGVTKGALYKFHIESRRHSYRVDKADPVGLLYGHRADIAIVSEIDPDETVDYHPLFRFEIVALVANDHPLAEREYLVAEDFATDTLITYPVPDDMLDVVRQVLKPAGVQAARRTTELTVAMLQLVASKRGIATLPIWAAQNYLNRDYVRARRIGTNGLTGRLYAACLREVSAKPYLTDFVNSTRESCYLNLDSIELL